jgi:hypothetical protein
MGSAINLRGKNPKQPLSLMGHFRPIRGGYAMSGYPPEADIGTASIYE